METDRKTFFSFRFVRDTLKTTFLSSLGKAIGFLIPFLIAAWFGSTRLTDSFFFIYGLVIFLSGIFAATISSVIVPYMAEMLAKKEETGAFIRSLFLICTVLLLLFLVVVGLFLAVVFLFFSPFSVATMKLGTLMLLEMIPLVLLLVWTAILEGVLQAGKRFSVPSFSLILRAGLTITVIFLLKPFFGIHAIIAGYIAGELLRFMLLVTTCLILRFFHLRFSFHIDPRVKDFLKNAAFQVLGVTAMGINPVIDKLMASRLPTGNVSVLYYAERIFMIPVTVLVSGILVTLLSYWSGSYYGAGTKQFMRDVSGTARWIILPALLVTGVFAFFSGPLVELAYGHGEMTAATVSEITVVTVMYFLGFCPLVAAQVYARALVVLKHTRALMAAAFLLSVGNIVCNLLFMTFLHVRGIALATSVVNLGGFFLLWHAFKKRMAVLLLNERADPRV